MATLHLIHGYIGSGKTTFAKKLEAEKDAVRFSIDEYMFDLFGANPPADKYVAYETSLKKMIQGLATTLLQKDIDVILDYGFWTQDERNEMKNFAENLKVKPALYKLQCDDSLAWQRVKKRNEKQDQLDIDKNAYDSLKNLFEPLSSNEAFINVT